jgi:hypothetical protein
VITHVYVTVVDDPVGPLLLEQLIPLTPVIDQDPVPVGVAPPIVPVTAAVKVKFPPSEAVGVLVVTVTVGVNFVIFKVKTVDGPALT